MSARWVDNLVAGCVALVMLFALVAFAKIFLSDTVATFIAGLGLGALGVMGVQLASDKQSRPG